MRRVVAFACEGSQLIGTLDEGVGTSGLLIVSGGNEVRTGAHRGMAQLARDVAAAGYPVFRFDRRGVGDSEGVNGGFKTSRADIVSALATFRGECPSLDRVIAFGNCDAATALRLHLVAEVDALVLANPWLVEMTADKPSPATTRAYYARRLFNPRAWAGLLGGAVDLAKLTGSLREAGRADEPTSLAARFAAMIAAHHVPTTILLASGDGTAVAFKAQWDSALFAGVRHQVPVQRIDSASHSFAGNADYVALKSLLLEALAR